DYFIYGSLAARSDTSRNTLLSLLEVAKGKVFDAWQTALHIDFSHEGVTVTSAGKDGEFGTADDMAISKRT
ncbi:MAG: hypothetical protein ACO1QR_11775, partial [Chthoniobacteraceae bacterium]